MEENIQDLLVFPSIGCVLLLPLILKCSLFYLTSVDFFCKSVENSFHHWNLFGRLKALESAFWNSRFSLLVKIPVLLHFQLKILSTFEILRNCIAEKASYFSFAVFAWELTCPFTKFLSSILNVFVLNITDLVYAA